MSTRRMIPNLLLLASTAALLASLSTCSHDPARDEASTFFRVISELRDAPNTAKRSPLERLRNLPCKAPDICAAKSACLDAFDHHVRGIELSLALRADLDGGSGPAPVSSAESMAAKLIEMNLEVEEGGRRMPDCNERVAALRRKHRL